MRHLFRSCLTAGVAIVTAAAVALGPSVQDPVPSAPPPPVVEIASPPIRLAAQVQPSVTATSLPNLLIGWLQRIVVPPSAGQPFPTPQFPPVVAPTSIGSSIIWVYNAVEPWARYVADVAAYAVGWIPYVGWLAPQITIFYNFGERIARSITYNIAYWLDGNISFVQGLINVGVDTVNSFIQLGIDEWNFFLPPLPPLPPFPLASTQATQATKATQTTAADDVAAISAAAPDEKAADAVTLKVTKKPKKGTAPTVTSQNPKRVKKADEGATATAATRDDSGTKHDKKTEKKDDTGKRTGKE